MKRSHMLYLTLAVALLFVGAMFIFADQPVGWPSKQTAGGATKSASEAKTFHIVTGEFKTTTPEGKEIEAYRFSPGHLVVNKGDRVTLHIHGVNGSVHNFQLKDFGIKGSVKKGETATVTFTPDRTGTFELTCLNHANVEQGGPMIGYITVLE